MKKLTVFVISLVLAFAFSTTGFALMRKDIGLVKGKVVASDIKKKTLTVDGERGEGKVNFDVSEARITTPTKLGNRVVVIYNKDTGKATWVKEVPPGR